MLGRLEEEVYVLAVGEDSAFVLVGLEGDFGGLVQPGCSSWGLVSILFWAMCEQLYMFRT